MLFCKTLAMNILRSFVPVWAILLVAMCSCEESSEVFRISEGLIINESVVFSNDTLLLERKALAQPVLVIEGEGITVDFGGSLLNGSQRDVAPDQFSGLAVLVRNSKNVHIRNLAIKGYNVALMVENTDSLILEDCDFSYNYRQRLKSTPSLEDPADQLDFQKDESGEWLRYGAAVYLKDCTAPIIRKLTVTGGQNGIVMSNCNDGQLYNNTIQYNSGVGISLFESSFNQIMHNQLDWNVRGYSFGHYSSGLNSAGMVCGKGSSGNLIAFNSATHCGNGLMAWSDDSETKTSISGVEANIIHGNDFSYTPGSGISTAFGRNVITSNRLYECGYGIRIENDQGTRFELNDIQECDHEVSGEWDKGNTVKSKTADVNALPDGIDAMLPEAHLKGRKYILVTEWGPYDFRRPIAWLRSEDQQSMTFLLLGPQGNWRLTGGEGFTRVNPKTGTFPVTVSANIDPQAQVRNLEMEFVGEAVTTEFGEYLKRGSGVSFSWSP